MQNFGTKQECVCVCDTRVQKAVLHDPQKIHTYDPDKYWVGDPWAAAIQQEIHSGGTYLPLEESDLFFLPKKFITKPRPAFTVPQGEGHRNRTKTTSVGYTANFGLNRSLNNEKLSDAFQSRKSGMNVRMKIDEMDSNQIHQCVNRISIDPLWSYNHPGPIVTDEFGITRTPIVITPCLVARSLVVNNHIELLDGSSIDVEPWVLDEFDPEIPGALYLGHKWYYVWYPHEVDPADVYYYKCYLSVVSRVDRLERLIQSAQVPLAIRKLLVPIQDMYHQLMYYMEQNNVYTDMELDCYYSKGASRSETLFTLPSGRNINLKMYTNNPAQQQEVYKTRAIYRINQRLIYEKDGKGCMLPTTMEPSLLGRHWPDHNKIRHHGSLPDYTKFLEHIGFFGKRRKQDVAHIDPDIIKVLNLFLKAAMMPLKKRAMSSYCINHLNKCKLAYTTVYEMVIASLCGYYPHVQYCTSFYRRHAVYRWLVFKQPTVAHMQEWLNAGIAPDAAFVGTEYFDKQNTIISILKEYVYSMVGLVPALSKYMDNTFYSRKLTIDAFRTMDEYRRMVDDAMYGVGQRWSNYQRNYDHYSASIVKSTINMRLNLIPMEKRTCYDTFYLDHTNADFDNAAYLPQSTWHFIVRFFVESIAIAPNMFAPNYHLLSCWFVVPLLWVCKGGKETDTLQSLIEDLIQDRLGIDSVIEAIALKPSYMRRSLEAEDSNVLHVRNFLVDIFNAALKPEYHSNAPWRLFGHENFEEAMELYIGADGDIQSDHRSMYYTMHGIHLVMDGQLCKCIYCRGGKCSEYEVYRAYQSSVVGGQLGAIGFGPMITRACEQMATRMYDSGVPYMYRIPNIPFVPFVVLKMEQLIEEYAEYPKLKQAMANVTEFERWWIALFAQACPVDDVGYQFLCSPPIQVDWRVIKRLLQAKNLFVTRSFPKRVYNLLRVFAEDNCRDFVILYLFFNEVKVRMMTTVGVLPKQWVQKQVEAWKKRYSKHFTVTDKLPTNAGLFWYCRYHGELKGLVANPIRSTQIVSNQGKKKQTLGYKLVNSYGTINAAVHPHTGAVYCRTTITNPTVHSFCARNSSQQLDPNLFERYGAISALEDIDVDGDDAGQSDRHSRLKHMALVNQQCQKPNEQIQMIGHVLYAHETAYVLCTNCAALMPYNLYSFNEYGLNCGECVAQIQQDQSKRLEDYVMFACILCTKGRMLYPARQVSCFSVLDDTHSGERFMRHVYLCQNHAKPELVRLMPYMTIAKFKKAIAGHIVAVHVSDGLLKHEFGQELAFKQRMHRSFGKNSQNKTPEYRVIVNRYVSTQKEFDLTGFVDVG